MGNKFIDEIQERHTAASECYMPSDVKARSPGEFAHIDRGELLRTVKELLIYVDIIEESESNLMDRALIAESDMEFYKHFALLGKIPKKGSEPSVTGEWNE